MSNPHPSDPRRYDEPIPGSIDPNDPVAPRPARRESISQTGQTNMMWAWVAGLAVLAVIIAFVFGGGSGPQTANNNEPVPQPRQTGSVERPAPPPAATTGQAPTQAPANTPAGTPQNPAGSGSTTTGSGTSQ